MANTSNNEINDYFIDLGLKGKLLRDMQTIVKTKEELSKFQLFVMDNEGKFRSLMQLVHIYVQEVQQTCTITEQEFVDGYKETVTIKDKQDVLEKVFVASLDNLVINKVEEILRNGLTLEVFYSKVKEYRGKYNPTMSVKMIMLDIERNNLIKC